jgi:hypothetical protein
MRKDEDEDDRQVTLSSWEYERDQYQYTSDSHENSFIVEVKESAMVKNGEVNNLVEDNQRFLKYESRREAKTHTEVLTQEGDLRVVLQNTAPQDSTEADVYMIGKPERHVQDPIDPSADTWEFGVGANQYGDIGEALITSPGSSPPALTYYIKQDIEHSEEEKLRVNLISDVARSKSYDEGGRPQSKVWYPDCIAQAKDGYGGEKIGEEYWCEIKTGDASFERNQTEVMRQKAAESGVIVVKIRVELDQLPERYSVRFHKIGSD